MTDKEQIIIDTNKYFVELTDEGRGTIGYTVVFPENLLEDIIRQNRQLARKTQECKKLNDKIIDMNSIIEDAAINLGNKDFTLYNLPFEIKKLRKECEIWKNQVLILDEEDVTVQVTQEQFEEYQKLKQECEELKKELNGSEKWRIKAESLNEKLSIEKYRYLKALEEIEDFRKKHCDFWCEGNRILDIINKAKGDNK